MMDFGRALQHCRDEVTIEVQVAVCSQVSLCFTVDVFEDKRNPLLKNHDTKTQCCDELSSHRAKNVVKTTALIRRPF